MRDHIDAWERLLPAWHLVTMAGLAFTTVGALVEGDLPGEQLPIALALVGAMAAGYALLFIRRTPGESPMWQSVVYLIAIGVLFAALLRLSTAYFWLQPVLFSQIFFLVPIRWSVPFVLYYTVIVLQYSAQLEGASLGDAVRASIGPLVTIGFFVVMAAWIGRIIEQSGERASLIRQLEAAQRELAEREREAGVLAERTRMSRELHDTLAQDLVGVVTHLQAADAAAETGQTSEAARHREEAARMARDGLAETRRLVWALRPAELDGTTLVESLERTLERWRATSGLRGSLTVTGAVRDLHPDVEVTLLRGAQEGLTNAARHGSATQVTVTLSYLDDTVTLDVHDDGVGFDPDAVTPATSVPGTGLGLRGMRERAERLGGAVAIESTPGEGTTVGLSLPAPSASS